MINTFVFTDSKLYIGLTTYGKREPRIKKQVAMDYPNKTYADGRILDATLLAHEIEVTLKKKKMKAQNAIFAISHSDISVVDFSIPNVKGKLTQAVHQVLAGRFVGIQDKNYIGYKLRKLEGQRYKGCSVAVPKMILGEYYDLSKKLGLKLQSVDYIGNVLYKSAILAEPKLKKATGIIMDNNVCGLRTYFFTEGGMVFSRGENESSLFPGEGNQEADFSFEERLEMEEGDVAAVQKSYESVPKKLDELMDFQGTITFFLNRYAAKKQEGAERMQEAKEEAVTQVIELRNLCDMPFEFVPNCEKRGFTYFSKLKKKVQGLANIYSRMKPANPAFFDEIAEVLTEIETEFNTCIERFRKYLEEEQSPEEYQRNMLIQRACRLLNSTMMMVDLNGGYSSIDYVLVDGMDLTDKEKKLIRQNVSKYYTGKILQNSDWGSTPGERWIGASYNEYTYFSDLDLSAELEKNDKYNRTNMDNLVLGLGVVACLFVVARFGLAGWNIYQMYNMNQEIQDNEAFLAANEEVRLLVDQQEKLQGNLDEVSNFESFFQAARVDLSQEYSQVSGVYSPVQVVSVSQEEDNTIRLQIDADDLSNVSRFVEMMVLRGYEDCMYTNVTRSETGYKAEVTYRYSPDETQAQDGAQAPEAAAQEETVQEETAQEDAAQGEAAEEETAPEEEVQEVE